MSTLGQIIRDARLSKGWTQTQLAEKAQLTRKHISSLERDEANVSVNVLVRVAAALELSELSLGKLMLGFHVPQRPSIRAIRTTIERATKDLQSVLRQLDAAADDRLVTTATAIDAVVNKSSAAAHEIARPSKQDRERARRLAVPASSLAITETRPERAAVSRRRKTRSQR